MLESSGLKGSREARSNASADYERNSDRISLAMDNEEIPRDSDNIITLSRGLRKVGSIIDEPFRSIPIEPWTYGSGYECTLALRRPSHLDKGVCQVHVVRPRNPISISNQKVHLTNIDHVLPPQHVQQVYYWPTHKITVGFEQLIAEFAQSLSALLEAFPCIGGRLVLKSSGRLEVDCSDVRIPLFQALVNCSLSEEDFRNLPVDPVLVPEPPSCRAVDKYSICLFKVQVTKFQCGSIVMATAGSHCLFDGQSYVHLMKCWSDLCKGREIARLPIHRPLASLSARTPPMYEKTVVDDFLEFPREIWDEFEVPPLDVISKVFHFSAAMIESLKIQANKNNSVSSSSRGFSSFVSLGAHLWKYITIARTMDPRMKFISSIDTSTLVRFLVVTNIRERVSPPIPDTYFGNAVMLVPAEETIAKIIEEPLSHIAQLIHRRIISVDDEYVKSRIDWLESAVADSAVTFNINPAFGTDIVVTHWAALPAYLDLGFGTPSHVHWFRDPTYADRLVSILPSAPTSDSPAGVDVTINLQRPHMDILEAMPAFYFFG